MSTLTDIITAELVSIVTGHFPCRNFIETGTYYGDSSLWAVNRFENIHTIEIAPELYKNAIQKFQHTPVNCHFGNSVAIIPQLQKNLHGRTFYWLDGHWCGGVSGGEENECPLLMELAYAANGNDIVFIDDARLYLHAPPEPHKWHHWPTIKDICKNISDSYYMQVWNDIIMLFPHDGRCIADVVAFIRAVSMLAADATPPTPKSPNPTNSRRPVLIVQASPPRTGSTVLTNLLYGLVSPTRKVLFSEDVNEIPALQGAAAIIKTHALDLERIAAIHSECYDLYFVCSERGWARIDKSHHRQAKVLLVEYEDLLESEQRPLEQIVEDIHARLQRFLPPWICLNKAGAIERLRQMNSFYETIKHLPFSHCDDFFHLHGSHRNRDEVESAISVSGE